MLLLSISNICTITSERGFHNIIIGKLYLHMSEEDISKQQRARSYCSLRLQITPPPLWIKTTAWRTAELRAPKKHHQGQEHFYFQQRPFCLLTTPAASTLCTSQGCFHDYYEELKSPSQSERDANIHSGWKGQDAPWSCHLMYEDTQKMCRILCRTVKRRHLWKANTEQESRIGRHWCQRHARGRAGTIVLLHHAFLGIKSFVSFITDLEAVHTFLLLLFVCFLSISMGDPESALLVCHCFSSKWHGVSWYSTPPLPKD